MNTETACIIFAAGKSSRMNFPKALLQFNATETFLTHIIEVYKNAGVKNIAVVTSSELKEKISNKEILFVINDEPEKGRFISVKKGIQATSNFEFCFIQNVDNPFVTEELLEQLFNAKSLKGSTAPIYNNKSGHPVLISKEVILYINSLPEEDANLRDVLNQFPKTKVRTNDAKVLVNINTMEEYEKWCKINHT